MALQPTALVFQTHIFDRGIARLSERCAGSARPTSDASR